MSICLINGEFEEDQAVKKEEDGEWEDIGKEMTIVKKALERLKRNR